MAREPSGPRTRKKPEAAVEEAASDNGAPGSKRTYLRQADVPNASLDDALRVPQAIYDHYAGKSTSPLHVARVRTHWSEPEDDGGSEGDGGEEGGRTAIVAGGDTAPVLEPTEHDLDAAAAPVAALVVPDRLVA